jgi:protoporphyrinogen oxidase
MVEIKEKLMKPFAVLGTGMAALGAGYVLEREKTLFTCFDKNNFLGGHTRSFRYPNGFVFDEGGHISFTKSSHVRDFLASSVAGKFEETSLNIDNYWHGRRIPHPVQCNLRGLPADLVVKVIEDFVSVQGKQPDMKKNYAQWLLDTYGRMFAETFPMVYGHKYHTTTMDRLTTDWIGPRMYRPSLEQVLRGALGESTSGTHYVDTFRYPSRGGFVSYLEPFAARSDVRLDHCLTLLDPREKTLQFANGAVVAYEQVISSVPLPDLIPLIKGVPADVVEAARQLAWTYALMFNLGIDRSDLSDAAITYFYDEDIIFSRVNLPHMFSRHNALPGCGTIQAEVYFSKKYKPFRGRTADLLEQVLGDLRRCGFIRESDKILLQDSFVNQYANVIYDHDRANALKCIHGYLQDIRVHYCGRYGNWDHAWTDEAFVSGESAAENALRAVRLELRAGGPRSRRTAARRRVNARA